MSLLPGRTRNAPRSADLCHAPRAVKTRSAFTLVELLVVIGIIAVLVGVLLPTLGRAREQGRSAACLSNMRQIAIAFIMYANDNKGWLPASARGGNNYANDWIQYQPTANMDRSAIGKYLGKITDNGLTNSASNNNKSINVNVLRCPSDDVKFRVRGDLNPVAPATAYRYSYVMNHYLGTGWMFQSYLANPNFTDVSGARGRDAVGKITQVRRASEKMLIFEEAESTMDDGHSSPDVPTTFCNLLAIRHDRQRVNKEPTASFSVVSLDVLRAVWNGRLKGNVAFCDGSARSMARIEMHRPEVYLPRR